MLELLHSLRVGRLSVWVGPSIARQGELVSKTCTLIKTSLIPTLINPCRKAKAIELMVVDAMLEADAELRIAERIADPDLFVTLDDTLLKQIEWHGLLPGLVRPRPHSVQVPCMVFLPSVGGLPKPAGLRNQDVSIP